MLNMCSLAYISVGSHRQTPSYDSPKELMLEANPFVRCKSNNSYFLFIVKTYASQKSYCKNVRFIVKTFGKHKKVSFSCSLRW